MMRTVKSKLVITMDPEIHKEILAAAARDGVSISVWMTTAARQALQRRAGVAAVAEWDSTEPSAQRR
jgi:predicted HicB family RNase H-like nuclease